MQQKIKDLIIKYLSNDINADELSELYGWLNDDIYNKELFNKFQTAWFVSAKTEHKQLGSADKHWKNFLMMAKQMESERKGRRLLFIKYRKTFALAASWAIFIIIGSVLLKSRQNALDELMAIQKSPTEIIAPKGAKCKVVLPDSSTVWLNAGSKIKYNKSFNIKDRTIELLGEAYFDVAKNEDCEFKVKTSELIIRALGTKFNVKAYPDEETVTATLEEGKIDVKLVNGKKTSEDIVLKPSENIIFYKAKNKIQIVASHNNESSQQNNEANTNTTLPKIKIISDVNTKLFTSWKDDRWIILGEPLQDLSSKLERRFNVKIIFADEELRNYKFSGTIENETIEQILHALKLTAPLKYKIKKNTVILSIDNKLKRKYNHIITPNNDTE
jgi:ferric-dicitrate binding protein FerR (iron transport regulator)